MHDDAFVAQHLENRGRNVGVFASGQLRSGFQDRHATAEAAIGLRQLQADIAAADHDQVAGQPIELQCLDIGERRCRCETRNLGYHRMGPEVENHALARQDPCAAVIEADFDGFRFNEPAAAHDQLGPARLVIVEMHGDQAIDHLSLARQHRPHVDGGRTRHHPELVRMAHQIGDLGAPDLILAG